MKKFEIKIEENLEKEILDFLKKKGVAVREVKPSLTAKDIVTPEETEALLAGLDEILKSS